MRQKLQSGESFSLFASQVMKKKKDLAFIHQVKFAV